MTGRPYLHHIDDQARFQGRPDDNLIITSLVVDDSEYGSAVKVYMDGVAISATSAEFYLDAAQAEALGGELLLLAIKLNQIAELSPAVKP